MAKRRVVMRKSPLRFVIQRRRWGRWHDVSGPRINGYSGHSTLEAALDWMSLTEKPCEERVVWPPESRGMTKPPTRPPPKPAGIPEPDPDLACWIGRGLGDE